MPLGASAFQFAYRVPYGIRKKPYGSVETRQCAERLKADVRDTGSNT